MKKGALYIYDGEHILQCSCEKVNFVEGVVKNCETYKILFLQNEDLRRAIDLIRDSFYNEIESHIDRIQKLNEDISQFNTVAGKIYRIEED